MNLLNKKWLTSALALVLLLAGCQNTQEEINEDTTPPWIDVKQYLIETYEGKEVDLDIATAYDAQDGICDVERTGFVDWNKVGDYFVVYTASDTSGNQQEVAITVRVLPPIGNDSIPSKNDEAELINPTCEVAGALDPNIPCSQVLNAEAIKYRKLFYGKHSLDVCNAEIGENEVCMPISANDGSFWGYGILVEEE